MFIIWKGYMACSGTSVKLFPDELPLLWWALDEYDGKRRKPLLHIPATMLKGILAGLVDVLRDSMLSMLPQCPYQR